MKLHKKFSHSKSEDAVMRRGSDPHLQSQHRKPVLEALRKLVEEGGDQISEAHWASQSVCARFNERPHFRAIGEDILMSWSP